MEVGVERFVGGFDFLETGLDQCLPELLINHVDTGLQRLGGLTLGILGSGQSHVKIIHHRDQFLEERLVCKTNGFLFFTGSPLPEIVEISGHSQQAFPMLIRLGGALFEVFKLFRGYGVDRKRHKFLRSGLGFRHRHGGLIVGFCITHAISLKFQSQKE